MRLKKDNRGSAIIIIIVVIAFVSILISTLYTVVAINVQMKSIDRSSKKNFYSAEGVLEQINLGLQEEMSIAAEKAYKEVMQNYTTSKNETVRQLKFNTKLVEELENALKDGTVPAGNPKRYDLAKLQGYLKDDVQWDAVNGTGAVIESPFVGENLEIDNVSKEYIILKDVKITYTDSYGYQSIIETDIRLSSPKLNLVEEGDIPSIFEYSLIANEQLTGTGRATIGNNVYAGQGGIKLDRYGINWTFDGTGRVVSKGDINLEGATVLVDSNKELWANEIGVGNDGKLFANGRTYVADDLELGKNAEATLAGEYYGFGNGLNLDASGNSRVPGGPSSAILVNGTKAKLDLSDLDRLLISGSAQIATGSEEYNPNLVGSTPIEKNEYENMRNGAIANGFYKIRSVENTDDYWTIVNQNAVVDRTSTVLRVTYNADATISFYDNVTGRYFKVNSDGSITANADRISTETKFLPEYPQGKTGQYALKAAMNGKYVTISDRNSLTATRDKVTSEYQLFTFESTTLSIPVNADENNVLEPGTYAIYSYSEARYLQSVGQNNAIQATAVGVGATTDNAEQFTLAKEDDNGGFSLRTVTNPHYLKPEVNTASILVKPNGGNARNERLNIRLEPSDVGIGFYYLRTTDDYYLFVDETTKELQAVPATMTNPQNATDEQKRSGSFQFVLVNPNVDTGTGGTETFEGTGVYPVYGMTYSAEDKAVATIQASALSNMTIAYARIRYQVTRNGVMVSDETVDMTVNAGKASATISGLNNGDSVVYSISYRYASEDVLRTADRNLYVHQRLSATGSPYENSNRNVNLGESVEVKSNQIAYLVPAECVGVYKGKTIFGHNPMTAEEWNKLETAAKDTGTYPDGLEIVSLTKQVSSLNNKTLGYYAGTGNKGYQEVFVQSGNGSSMVYLYVNFNDSDKTSEYFQDYYEKNQDTMQDYMKQYVPNLTTGNFTRLTLDGNMVTSLDGNKIDLKASGNYGLPISADEKKEEEEKYQQQFIGLCTNLKLEYPNGITGDVYENLIQNDHITNISYGNGDGTNGAGPNATAIAMIVAGDYTYRPGDNEHVCLILARGDVTINRDFSGIVIAQGKITVSDNVRITNNRDALKKILAVKVNDDETIASYYFKDVNLLGEGSDATITSETGYAKYSDCISYENWTKE